MDPLQPIPTTNLDAGSDSPLSAQTDLLEVVQRMNGIGLVPCSQYGTLNQAVIAIGSLKRTLAYGADVTVSANITIPSNIELLPYNDAVINHSTYTISYSGSTERWNMSKKFNGTGAITGFSEVRPEWFGAKGDDSTDDRQAFICAAASGGEIVLRSKTYWVSSNIPVTGILRIRGVGENSSIRCNGYAFTVTNGHYSHLDNFAFLAPTGAYMVNRWAANGDWLGTPVYGYNLTEGYQMTGNDPEWEGLTAPQKTYVVTGIKFITSNKVKVSRIYGRFVSLWLSDSNDSSVERCRFHGGATTYGGIYFGATAATKLQGNKAHGNTVMYSSNCGITYEGQDGISITGNTIRMCGESGIKQMQNTYSSLYSLVSDNISNSNYYDGIDLLTNFPVTGSASPSACVVSNCAKNNRLSGINIEGTGNLIQGGVISGNGAFGIWGIVSYSTIMGVMLPNNNKIATAGYASLYVEGNNNTIATNSINNTAAGYLVNNCMFVKGNNNKYYNNDLYTSNTTSLYVEGTNNIGWANKGLKAVNGTSLDRYNRLIVDNMEQAGDDVGIDFVVRWGMRKPTGSIKSLLTNGVPGSEYSNMYFYTLGNGTEINPLILGGDGYISMPAMPVYADNAAAVAGGRAAGNLYRTAAGDLRIVY